MHLDPFEHHVPDIDPQETLEWMESFDAVVRAHGLSRAHYLLGMLLKRSQVGRVSLPALIQTPYVNTIPPEEEPSYPGDYVLEKRLRRIIRWNAVAMVVRANERFPGIGGHLSTYASAASLYEVGFNHFFHGKQDGAGDLVYFQGHASPGIYARAFLEGRVTIEQMEHFRREVECKGLSSYPHPWLMPDFWEFPTVSMGLGPIAAIYQARFARYLANRGLQDTSGRRVWCFLGDGECDEPEALGALSIAAREGLDNLTFVVNCNLQRLDGPVRGNGKVIQELEAVFHGAGWNVLKVVWGKEWDELLAKDYDGLLRRRMEEVLDGQYQKYSVEDGAYTRHHFFGADPRLLRMVEHLSDSDIRRLRRGGHDMVKIYAAFDRAVHTKGRPTAILAKTVKGWTLGGGAEARNVAHQVKKFSLDELRAFRDRLELPISNADLERAPFYLPDADSPEMEYLRERRRVLGGPLPQRTTKSFPVRIPAEDQFGRYFEGTGAGKEVSTTGAFARLLGDLLRDAELGRRIVPIIPDEARTFGLDALFRRYGIYSAVGQLYEPVDKELLLSYREAKDGQVLEEGICEAGAMASFTAAGTSYANHGEPMVPFYIFYSMFGFQRTGDQAWAFGDSRGRGFLLGATAGRTTLNGEGLQHADGHSQLLAGAFPNVVAYDPAFHYEITVIVLDGLRRMLEREEDLLCYLTLHNEAYEMPAPPEGLSRQALAEGILAGIYPLQPAPDGAQPQVTLLGSGSILLEVLRAQGILAERYGVGAAVYAVPGWLQLRRQALDVERWNLLHPDQEARTPHLTRVLEAAPGPVVAATDWMKAVPDQIARWVPGGLYTLGTDGFGMSDTRKALRRHFEVDAETIAYAALFRLWREGAFPKKRLLAARKELGVDPGKRDPMADAAREAATAAGPDASKAVTSPARSVEEKSVEEMPVEKTVS